FGGRKLRRQATTGERESLNPLGRTPPPAQAIGKTGRQRGGRWKIWRGSTALANRVEPKATPSLGPTRARMRRARPETRTKGKRSQKPSGGCSDPRKDSTSTRPVHTRPKTAPRR